MATSTISFQDRETQRCPFAAYDELRQQGPVYFDQSCGWYVIVDYDEVRRAAADPITFSSNSGILLVKDGPEADVVNAIYEAEGYLPVNSLATCDPPLHTFHRSLVDKVFTVSRVRKMESYILSVVNEMIDEIKSRHDIEFFQQFAMKIPTYIIADQLGVPRSEFATFKRWSDAVIAEGDVNNTLEEKKAITRTICDLQNYIARMVDIYRANPADCMLSDLVHARNDTDGRQLSLEEIVSMVVQILVAGNDTTTTAMTTGMYRLITTPGLEQQLRDDRSLIVNFIEEVLRRDSPVQGLWRRTSRAVRIGDTDIPEGAIVVLKWGAANRDPGQFPDPASLEIRRSNARQHLAFGSGPHFCIGNQLARGELRTTFNRLLDNMRNFRLARGEDGVSFAAHFFGYGVTRLEISFDPIV